MTDRPGLYPEKHRVQPAAGPVSASGFGVTGEKLPD